MIKLIAIASFPLLAAMYCAEQAPELEIPLPSPLVEIEDRHFLAALESREAMVAGRVERLDREFLARLQAQPSAPTAVAVRESSVEVRRATAVRPVQTTPVTAPVISRRQAVTRLEPPAGERRRASIVIRGDTVVLR